MALIRHPLRSLARLPLALALASLVGACGEAAEPPPEAPPAETAAASPPAPAPADSLGDHAAVGATIERFHAALEAGDSTAALALLAPDVLILEAGGLESFDEYREHHLAADIAFAGGLRPERALVQVTVHGDVAWAVSESIARGELDGTPVDSQGAELMVLTRTADGWSINAIHWSSRRL